MSENPDQSVTEYRHVPDILKVPEANVLLLRADGSGVQKYACPVSTTSKTVPNAILLAGDRNDGDLVAIYFAGPTWEALDGSLLHPAKSTTGSGLFVSLYTDGGKPPAAGCDQ
jgi:hypothetical protein